MAIRLGIHLILLHVSTGPAAATVPYGASPITDRDVYESTASTAGVGSLRGAMTHLVDPVWDSTYSSMLRSRELVHSLGLEPAYAVDVYDDNGEVTIMGSIRFARSLAVTSESTIREVVVHGRSTAKPIVAKYTNDCSRLLRNISVVSPFGLTNEFVYLSAINGSGIAPDVYHLSPLTKITTGLSAKVRSNTFRNHADRCIAAGASVQMLLQDKTGAEVGAYLHRLRGILPDSIVYLHSVLRVVIKTLTLLQRLHSLGLVHGDVHAGNIMFKSPKESIDAHDVVSDDLILIDFELAQFFPNSIGSPDTGIFDRGLNPMCLSPWQLEGSRLGRRDDVYRTIEMMAGLLSDNELASAWKRSFIREWSARVVKRQSKEVDPSDVQRSVYLQCKTRTNMFLPERTLATECCKGMGLSLADRFNIQSRLEDVVKEARDIRQPDAEPDYDKLKSMLQRIIDGVDMI